MAETASIFSEMLLGEKVKSLVTPEEYKEYLNERLGDIFSTIFRQVQYVIFEREVHNQIHSIVPRNGSRRTPVLSSWNGIL